MASTPIAPAPTPSTVATFSSSEADRMYARNRDSGFSSTLSQRLSKFHAKHPDQSAPLASRPAANPPANQPAPGGPQPQNYSQPQPQQQLQPPQYHYNQPQPQEQPQQYHYNQPPSQQYHYNQPPPQQYYYQPQPLHYYNQPQQQLQLQQPQQTPVSLPPTPIRAVLHNRFYHEIQHKDFDSRPSSRQQEQVQQQVQVQGQGQVEEEELTNDKKARMESLLLQFKEGMEAAMSADFEMRRIVYEKEFP